MVLFPLSCFLLSQGPTDAAECPFTLPTASLPLPAPFPEPGILSTLGKVGGPELQSHASAAYLAVWP